MSCSGRRNCRVVRIDRREGERENNTFWYIKELIERELNKAYKIKPQSPCKQYKKKKLAKNEYWTPTPYDKPNT